MHGVGGGARVSATRGEEAPIRLVIVDDHPVVRDGLVGMFAADDALAVVGTAGGGREAIAVIDEVSPDVVLIDLRMPGGDGIEAIRALRADGRREPRILVLTTYDSERDMRAALDAGADGYLLKDARRADLVRAVRDIAAGRPVLSREALHLLAGRRRTVELTARELEVLRVIAGGGTNRTAADTLLVSEATVKTHLVHVYDKLGVSDRAAAVRVAFERGLL